MWMAQAQFLSGKLLASTAVPVFTLKYLLHERQLNGIVLCLQRYTLPLPQRKQDSSPPGKCTASNHFLAASSFGIHAESCADLLPSLRVFLDVAMPTYTFVI